MEMKEQLHLRDLFRVGQEVPIMVVMPDDTVGTIKIWMRAPTPELQQEAIKKAGSRAARVKISFRDKDGDEYVALRSQIDDMEERSQLEEFLLSSEDHEIREQAYNDILYGEWGSNWSNEEDKETNKEPLDYMNVVQALYARKEEIAEINKDLEPGDRLGLESDEEHTRLVVIYDQFQSEVEERLGALRQVKSLKFQNQTDEDLRVQIAKKLIDLESRQAWLIEYNTWLLFYACRNMDDKKKFYFRDPFEIQELPDHVQTQLNDAFREVNRAGSDLKASATPVSSSVLSEPSVELVEDSNPSIPVE